MNLDSKIAKAMYGIPVVDARKGIITFTMENLKREPMIMQMVGHSGQGKCLMDYYYLTKHNRKKLLLL